MKKPSENISITNPPANNKSRRSSSRKRNFAGTLKPLSHKEYKRRVEFFKERFLLGRKLGESKYESESKVTKAEGLNAIDLGLDKLDISKVNERIIKVGVIGSREEIYKRNRVTIDGVEFNLLPEINNDTFRISALPFNKSSTSQNGKSKG